jgi:hypothetical protein
MSQYKYTEKEIISVMNFAGFTRQEVINYLNEFTEIDYKRMHSHEQESKALEQLFASF